jgi:hypothetical protein
LDLKHYGVIPGILALKNNSVEDNSIYSGIQRMIPGNIRHVKLK